MKNIIANCLLSISICLLFGASPLHASADVKKEYKCPRPSESLLGLISTLNTRALNGKVSIVEKDGLFYFVETRPLKKTYLSGNRIITEKTFKELNLASSQRTLVHNDVLGLEESAVVMMGPALKRRPKTVRRGALERWEKKTIKNKCSYYIMGPDRVRTVRPGLKKIIGGAIVPITLIGTSTKPAPQARTYFEKGG